MEYYNPQYDHTTYDHGPLKCKAFTCNECPIIKRLREEGRCDNCCVLILNNFREAAELLGYYPVQEEELVESDESLDFLL